MQKEILIYCDTCGLRDFHHETCETCIKYKLHGKNGYGLWNWEPCTKCTHAHVSNAVQLDGTPYPCLYEENVETRTFECPKDGSRCKMSLSYCHFECEKRDGKIYKERSDYEGKIPSKIRKMN